MILVVSNYLQEVFEYLFAIKNEGGERKDVGDVILVLEGRNHSV